MQYNATIREINRSICYKNDFLEISPFHVQILCEMQRELSSAHVEKGIETTEGATVEQKKLGRDKIDDLPLFGEIFKKQPNFPYHILS